MGTASPFKNLKFFARNLNINYYGDDITEKLKNFVHLIQSFGLPIKE